MQIKTTSKGEEVRNLIVMGLAALVLGGCSPSSQEAVQTQQAVQPKKEDFTLTASPGTDMSGATSKFKVLVGHCPGINKYKADVEKVEYGGNSYFRVMVAHKPSVLPAESYGSGHTCHFSVDDSKATVSKSPCAWLCTGEDMTGIDGNEHSYAQGKLIGPKVRPWENLSQAIASTRLEMADIEGADVSMGAAKLALWGINNMRWAELQEISTTQYGLVMKDPDSQRGQRLCTSGNVIEIALDRSVPGQKIFVGGMYDSGGRIYRFVAVQSTGEIMANSRARFCGIVTGQQHYQNSVGGVAHAVHLVGMFDLPENKMPQ